LTYPALILAALFPLLVFAAQLPDREESASLLFRQRAGSPDTRIYVVQKGDWLAGIVRNQLGTKKISYALIRRLNPKIRNLNRIYPGQRIILPLAEQAATREVPPEKAPIQPETPVPEAYRIQPGDSLGRIIQEALRVPPEEVLSTYQLVRRLNPGLKDPQNLPTGEILNLPPGIERRIPGPPTASQPTLPAPKAPVALAKASSLPGWMEITRSVLARMNGSLLTQGYYVIPLDGNAQLSIDCARLPVAELDDGTTVLLDFPGLLSEAVKTLIRRSWPTHHVLAADEMGDPVTGLRGIIGRSRHYAMAPHKGPLRLLASPEVLFYPDWMIQAPKTSSRAPYRQGLLLHEGEESLPADVLNLLEKNGLPITEIATGTVLTSPAAPPPALPHLPGVDLNSLRGIALAEQLLNILGVASTPIVEVPIFEPLRDGFRLSITADLLVEREGKRFLLHSERLPEQFINILRQAGTTYIFCDPQQGGRPAVENLLTGLEIPFAFGYFSFRIPEASTRPRLTVSLPAFRVVHGDEPFYLSDFSPPPEVETLFSRQRWGRIFRY
jgi:LysM repeat protein